MIKNNGDTSSASHIHSINVSINAVAHGRLRIMKILPMRKRWPRVTTLMMMYHFVFVIIILCYVTPRLLIEYSSCSSLYCGLVVVVMFIQYRRAYQQMIVRFYNREIEVTSTNLLHSRSCTLCQQDGLRSHGVGNRNEATTAVMPPLVP